MVSNLDEWARIIAAKSGFRLVEKLYQGTYYTPAHIRNVIYEGIYKDAPAVLKVYNDPRITDEPASLAAFHRVNHSTTLRAPALYESETVSPHAGWLIMERLPKEGRFFRSPLERGDKFRFASIYREYRSNFPSTPTRALSLAEQLGAEEFYTFRIARWLELANYTEEERRTKGEKRVLNQAEFNCYYARAVRRIRTVCEGREMIWSHGHFKPSEIYELRDQDIHYLIDFAHTKMYPVGHELAFIVWSDHLMAADWRLSYEAWKEGVDEWLEVLRPLTEVLGISDFDILMRANLLERCLGSILADITATDRPYNEKVTRIRLLYTFMEELLA
ncbi:MAG: hypothetical protein HY460_02765 [Parcubacteria group bacterium]|nr:hypothetical protein [Parcubacteria group bacterium]